MNLADLGLAALGVAAGYAALRAVFWLVDELPIRLSGQPLPLWASSLIAIGLLLVLFPLPGHLPFWAEIGFRLGLIVALVIWILGLFKSEGNSAR